MTSAIVIKRRIKAKFGTISQFARLTGKDRYGLQKLFAKRLLTSSESSEIGSLIARTKVRSTSVDIDPKKLESLKEAIKAFGGTRAFCNANATFSLPSVKQILEGRRKRMSPVVKALFEHFKIE